MSVIVKPAFLAISLWLCAETSALAQPSAEASPVPNAGIFSIRAFGAAGDGKQLDTEPINRAIESCAQAGGGQVRFPPGRYLSGTLTLRSHVHLVLETGATLVGTTNLTAYRHPQPLDFQPGRGWSKWYRGLLVGEDIEDFSITGQGVIDGAKVFDPRGEEGMRGPHTIMLADCRNFSIRDLTLLDSANYAIFFLACDNVQIRGVRFVGGWDGVHWRGTPERWCHNVKIVNCEFYTGDDALAGSYWENTLIHGCVINSSCNGIRLIGPAKALLVNDCLFYGPGEQPHRTSREKRRTNMLCGILLQPGAWGRLDGPLEDVLLTDNVMKNVAAPVNIWIKPGNTGGRITVSGLNATEVYRSAFTVESWADEPIEEVLIRDVTVAFQGGGVLPSPKATATEPGVGVRPLPAWGFHARKVRNIVMEDVRLTVRPRDLRPPILAEDVDQFTLDNVRFTEVDGVTDAVVTRRVNKVNILQEPTE